MPIRLELDIGNYRLRDSFLWNLNGAWGGTQARTHTWAWRGARLTSATIGRVTHVWQNP